MRRRGGTEEYPVLCLVRQGYAVRERRRCDVELFRARARTQACRARDGRVVPGACQECSHRGFAGRRVRRGLYCAPSRREQAHVPAQALRRRHDVPEAAQPCTRASCRALICLLPPWTPKRLPIFWAISSSTASSGPCGKSPSEWRKEYAELGVQEPTNYGPLSPHWTMRPPGSILTETRNTEELA